MIPNTDTGKKEPHPLHWSDDTFNDKYEQWVIQNQWLFAELNLKSIPCNETFQKRRRIHHPYIYHTPTNDWSNCSRHFNFKQRHSVLLHTLQNIVVHSCNKNVAITCSSHKFQSTPKCSCTSKCAYCYQASKKFNLKSTEFIKSVCCKNDDKLPFKKCLDGNCGVFNCGYKWITKVLLELHPNTHSFDNIDIQFDQIECLETTDEGRSIYGIKQHTQK